MMSRHVYYAFALLFDDYFHDYAAYFTMLDYYDIYFC